MGAFVGPTPAPQVQNTLFGPTHWRANIMAAPKQPQDHKPKAEKKVEPHDPSDLFEYTSRDGKHTFRLPYLENMTRGQSRRLREAEEAGEDVEDTLFSMLLDEDDLAALEELTLLDVDHMVTRWNAESAITLGESKAS